MSHSAAVVLVALAAASLTACSSGSDHPQDAKKAGAVVAAINCHGSSLYCQDQVQAMGKAVTGK